MGAGDEECGERQKLECFDGTQPERYRMWKRRAQLMTMSEKKFGPKLMSYVAGEAESALEHLPVEKLCDEGGDKLIWEVLDERYGMQDIDLMQTALKTYFYDLTIRNGELYRQFMVRHEAARRKLEEVKVKLPQEVLGFLFMKKLRLDQAAESMILTATSGKLEYDKVISATKSVFPEGKCNQSRGTKDVFQAEPEMLEDDDEDDEQKAMDVLAADLQAQEDYDDESILEAFESYAEVRKRMQEQKRNRGYYPRSMEKTKTEKFRFSGSVQGRIESLKARTRCHVCKQLGHWRRECPNKPSASSNHKPKDGGKEVLFIDADAKTQELWDAFCVTVSALETSFQWCRRTSRVTRGGLSPRVKLKLNMI
eukprot:s580_g23.t1